MEQHTLKTENNYLNTNIYTYLVTSGGNSYILYLNVIHFLMPVLVRHLLKLKTVVTLHWYPICASLLSLIMSSANSHVNKLATYG
jgi:hypothetical protein